MKIVILRSNPVNPDSRVEKEASSLIKSGFDVTIVGLDRSQKYTWKKDIINIGTINVPIYRIGIPSFFGGGVKNLVPMFKFNRKLYKFLTKKSEIYDCIHACDLDTGYIGCKVARKKKKIFVYDIFDYYSASHSFPAILRKVIKSMETRVINRADCTIICSEKRKEQIIDSKPKRLIYIHNSPSKAMLDNDIGDVVISKNHENIIKIGYVGILSRSRLLEEIIDVVKNRNDLEFHIGGFGQLESYMIDCSMHYPNIHFYGKLSYYETLKLEKKMDILTAIYDPTVENHRYAAPNKFYESIMLGKPLIMVRNTGFDQVITENNLGALIDFSKNGFEKGVDEIIAKKNIWNDISIRGQTLFEKTYSWTIMEKRLVNLYCELSKEKKR